MTTIQACALVCSWAWINILWRSMAIFNHTFQIKSCYDCLPSFFLNSNFVPPKFRASGTKPHFASLSYATDLSNSSAVARKLAKFMLLTQNHHIFSESDFSVASVRPSVVRLLH